MSDWKTTVQNISRAIDLSWPVGIDQIELQVTEFLDPSLRHHQFEDSPFSWLLEQGADEQITRWVCSAHEILTAAATDQSPVDHHEMDRIAGEFFKSQSHLAAWRSGKSPFRRLMKVEEWVAEQEKGHRAHLMKLENRHQEMQKNREEMAKELNWLKEHSSEVEKYCKELKGGIEWLQEQKSMTEEAANDRPARCHHR